MLITDYNRYNSAIFPVIETERFLIIDGKTYDKRSLALLNSEPIEVGIHELKGNLTREVLATKFAAYGDPAAYTIANPWYYNCTEGAQFFNEYDEADRVCSVTDIDNENIEWTFIGDRVLKYDLVNMKCEVIKCPKTPQDIGTEGGPITYSLFLHQDSDYIYLIVGNYYSWAYRHKFRVFNKKTHELTIADSIDTNTVVASSGRNANSMLRILTRHNGIVIYGTNSFMDSRIFTYRAVCLNGNITVTPEKMLWKNTTATNVTSGYVSNNMSMISNMDKYGWVYYPEYLSSSTSASTAKCTICAVKYNATDLVTASAAEQKFDILSVDNRQGIVGDLLKTYFKKQPGEELTDAEWRAALWLPGLENMMHQVHIAGENDEFLVIATINPVSAKADATKLNHSRILVFKRNAPETDPFNLTLTDIVMFKDLDNVEYYTSFFKEATNRYIAISKNKITFFTISNEGKLTYKNLVRPSVITWGLDEYRRLYYIDKTLKPQTFTNTQPYYLETEYKDPTDSYFVYSNQPVTKTMVVKLQNIKKEPVGGVVELSISGSGEFADNGTNFIRVTVPKTGSLDVDIIINSVGTTAISAKLVYNNELAIVGA